MDPTTTLGPTDADREMAGLPPLEDEVAEPDVAAGDNGVGAVAPWNIELEADGMPSVQLLHEAMRAVVDPEIGYNVVDLGLVYDIEKDDGHVVVHMTLTTMGCPLTELIHQQVSVVLGSLPGVESVDVDFVFTPPWTPDMIDEDVKLELRAMGMNI